MIKSKEFLLQIRNISRESALFFITGWKTNKRTQDRARKSLSKMCVMVLLYFALHKYCLTYYIIHCLYTTNKKYCHFPIKYISCTAPIYKYFYLKLKVFGTLLNLFRMKPS